MYRFLLFIIVATVPSFAALAQSDTKSEFKEIWGRAVDYSMETFDSIPENRMEFKLYEDMFTVKQQFIHLHTNISNLSSIISGGTPPKKEINQNISKAELREEMESVFNLVDSLITNIPEKALSEKVSFAGLEMPKSRIFFLIRDHMTHHRSQVVVCLRSLGITPPRYRGW